MSFLDHIKSIAKVVAYVGGSALAVAAALVSGGVAIPAAALAIAGTVTTVAGVVANTPVPTVQSAQAQLNHIAGKDIAQAAGMAAAVAAKLAAVPVKPAKSNA